ncbi:hypothetical protein [Thermoactinospora rubra]|uniref:hypothetical protein n=1 Tax=Thermoactinospora rubra TaxID=1088767 RepID=UPI00117D139B|nr:hypothetical protein [Thermoactinospora rubra]
MGDELDDLTTQVRAKVNGGIFELVFARMGLGDHARMLRMFAGALVTRHVCQTDRMSAHRAVFGLCSAGRGPRCTRRGTAA